MRPSATRTSSAGAVEKRCGGCKKYKPLEAFYENDGGRLGRHSLCRTCFRTRRDLKKVAANRRTRRSRDAGRWMFWMARARAKRRGIPFTLTPEDIKIPERCPLLGIPLLRSPATYATRDAAPSLDRIDSTKGYAPGNVWVISFRANAIKRNATLEELELLVRNLRAATGG